MTSKSPIKPFAQWPQTPAEFDALIFKLNDIDIISFDIFDTAVYRPFARPRDLFLYMEFKTGVKNFYQNRKTAARQTRATQKEKGINEVTLDEIYTTLGALDTTLSQNQLDELKSLEQETEIALCRPNQDLLAFYQKLLKLNKRIVFTTDMYLPEKTIKTILYHCGYTDYEKLILSATDRLTKKDGTRFHAFLNHDPKRILHIGDNPSADIQNAALNGIQTILYTPHKSAFLSHRLLNRLTKTTGLFSSFWRSQIQHQHMPDYWYSIGFQYTGPLLVHFCYWLNQQMKTAHLTKAAFMARDGQIIKQIFDTLYPDIAAAGNTPYVFASRLLMQTIQGQSGTVYADYLNALNLTADDFALIDVGRKGTLQHTLNHFLDKRHIPAEPTGYYIDCRTDHPRTNGYFLNPPQKYKRFLDFLDFLLIADHPLIVDIEHKDGFEPVCLAPDTAELMREQIARKMHQGAVDFARTALPFADLPDFYLSQKELLPILSVFLKFTKTDRTAFANVTVPFGLKNEKFRYVVPPRFSLKEWIRHPLNCLKIYRKSLVK